MVRRAQRAGWLCGGILPAVVLALAAGAAGQAVGPALAGQVLEAAGVKGGLVVHLGCGDGRLTAALGAGEGFLVHGLDADAEQVSQARKHIRSLGLYGKVSVDRWDGRRLPYVDNLVNLVVVDRPIRIPTEEVLRALAPNGVAYVVGSDAVGRSPKNALTGTLRTKTVKPRPAEIDEWTHCLHGADGNAVAKDARVGPPHHIQWVGPPRRARQHERLASVSAVVSAGGRVFSLEDRGPASSALLGPRWFLVARDAFNGVILWRRPAGPWEGHLKSFRSGPSNLARRLVAVNGRVYVTLGYGRPLCALDAATGRTIRTYKGTDGTAEIVCHGASRGAAASPAEPAGVLFLVAGDLGVSEAAQAAKRRGGSLRPRNQRILAIQADSGKLLWKKSDADAAGLMPTTLAAAGARVFFQNAQAVLCLDAKTGQEVWRAPRPVSVKRPGWSAPTLVVYDGVVLTADRATPGQVQKEPGRVHKTKWVDAPAGELIAFSAQTGRKLWTSPCRECFNAPVDVLVADGLVWTGRLVVAGEPGITVGRDPKTGEIKRRRPADQAFFQVGMPHHRCHRNRATDRYLVLSRAGVEFIDLATGRGLANHWVRGTCQFGVLPCNGLLYAPPHSCACYSKAKLNGFYALAPKRKPAAAKQPGPRLQRGPAYGGLRNPLVTAERAVAGQSAIRNPHDWPTYRRDGARSGSAKQAVPAALRRVWQADPGGKLSSVTIAGGRLFVASIDTHAVHALDAKDGKAVWRYTAGGRVDSPPTLHQGMALFGSADGWVYCLRASDGKLVWRFRAAPDDRRVVAYGQLESAWPVHGSVLVEDGVVAFAAGRSSYLDGGIYLYRLDAKTGKRLWRTCVNSRDPKTGRQPKGVVRMFDLPGALPDVLSTDGRWVYMRHVAFDRQGTRQPTPRPHLFSPTGFLDDTWWHRSYWILGTRFYTGYRDWFRAGREVPAGRLLVLDELSVYGFGRRPRYYYWSTPLEYHLFAADRKPRIVKSPQPRARVPAWGQRQIQYRWSKPLPLLARAMVLAEKTLFVAGPPDVLDEERAWKAPADPATQAALAEQSAALQGKRGALLWAVSASDGRKLAECRLDAPPVWDGLAAAGGRLYLAATDGTVSCFAGR